MYKYFNRIEAHVGRYYSIQLSSLGKTTYIKIKLTYMINRPIVKNQRICKGRSTYKYTSI